MNGSADAQRGQILPLMALFLVVLLGFAALAVDVSNAYAARRMYREVADAASLAGAQDLQGTSRAVTSTARANSRSHAYDVIKSRLSGGNLVAAPCNGNVTNFTADVISCPVPNTPFVVSIRTPSPTCVSCDRDHSVQVTIQNPSFPLSFAHILGAQNWRVASTSVAGLTFSSKYALMTLQPPHPRPNGSDTNLLKDLIVSGNNTMLNILQGDVGTNTSASTTNQGVIALADGYFIDHFDDLSSSGDTWSKPDGVHPIGHHITTLIVDPVYPYPSFTGATTYATQAAGETACTGANYPTDYGSKLTGVVKCYLPGIYTDPQGFRVGTGSGMPDSAYLMPGVYWFTQGTVVRGTLAGGLISSARGIDILVPQTQTIDANNAVNIILNIGGSTCATDACRATAALDFVGAEMKTSTGIILTIEVGPKDANCFTGTTPIDSASCNVNGNKTVQLAGNGTLAVAGAIYGPSDNMEIHANNTVQAGLVGQIVSWSTTYTGGAQLNQSYPGGEEIGVVRLDAACTAPTTPCNQ